MMIVKFGIYMRIIIISTVNILTSKSNFITHLKMKKFTIQTKISISRIDMLLFLIGVFLRKLTFIQAIDYVDN